MEINIKETFPTTSFNKLPDYTMFMYRGIHENSPCDKTIYIKIPPVGGSNVMKIMSDGAFVTYGNFHETNEWVFLRVEINKINLTPVNS